MRSEPLPTLVTVTTNPVMKPRPTTIHNRGMGPVTVMVLVHENVAAARMFDEGGYRGTIVPLPDRHGSIAVLVKGDEGDLAQVESVAARVKAAIVWTG